MQVVPWIGRTVVENAYVVEDLDAAMARWTTVFGVGPFFANCDIRVDDPGYRGEPSEFRFAGAIAQAGDVQIELIQQLDDSPSCYRDLYPAGREGFHHIADAGDHDRAARRRAQRAERLRVGRRSRSHLGRHRPGPGFGVRRGRRDVMPAGLPVDVASRVGAAGEPA